MEILTWQARTKRGLSLRQLEALTGISRTTLNNIENGLVSPTLQELETIARALDMKICLSRYRDIYASPISVCMIRVYNRIRGKDGDADGHTQANQ